MTSIFQILEIYSLFRVKMKYQVMPHVGKLSRIFIEMISPVETFACVLVQFAQKIQAFEF